MEIKTKFDIGEEIYTLEQVKEKTTCSLCRGEGIVFRDNKAYECAKCNSTGLMIDYRSTEFRVSEKKYKILTAKASVGKGYCNIKYRVRHMNEQAVNIKETMIFRTDVEAELKCKELNKTT